MVIAFMFFKVSKSYLYRGTAEKVTFTSSVRGLIRKYNPEKNTQCKAETDLLQ